MECNCGGNCTERTNTIKGEVVHRYERCNACGRCKPIRQLNDLPGYIQNMLVMQKELINQRNRK